MTSARRHVGPTALAAVSLCLTVACTASGPAPAADRPPRCLSAQLQLWWGMPGSGAAGSVYYELQFSDISPHACSLFGFPGVSAVTRSGQPLGSPAGRDVTSAPETVALAPGDTAHAVLRVTDVDVFPAATCHPVTAAGLEIYPPNARTAALLPLQIRACATKGPAYLSVRPVRPKAGIPGYSQ